MKLEQLHTQTCRIVTRGRRTGVEHVVQVWFATVGTRFYAASRQGLAGDGRKNALHAGTLEMRAARSSWRGPATLVAPDEAAVVVEAFAEKYQRCPEIIAAWRQHPPVFVRADLVPGE